MMVVRALYATGVDSHTMYVEFETELGYWTWQNEVMAIKRASEAITRNEEYPAWLDRVMRFRRAYGDSMVPHHIKEAVHSVEDGIGRERTVWDN